MPLQNLHGLFFTINSETRSFQKIVLVSRWRCFHAFSSLFFMFEEINDWVQRGCVEKVGEWRRVRVKTKPDYISRRASELTQWKWCKMNSFSVLNTKSSQRQKLIRNPFPVGCEFLQNFHNSCICQRWFAYSSLSSNLWCWCWDNTQKD
jgi:hypothetical protein